MGAIALSLTLLVSSDSVVAQVAPETPAMATSRPASVFDSQPILGERRATRNAATNAASRPGIVTPSTPVGVNITQLVLSLGIVLAIIGGLYWLVRRLYGGAATAATTRAVKVLTRTHLAPRQQAMLIQVGRRVIVVGDSNGTLSQLAQITEPDEVAELLGQIQAEQMQRAASFGSVFRRNQSSFEEPADDEADAAPADPTQGPPASAGQVEGVSDEELARQRSELSGLLEKVRSLRGQIDR